MMTMDSLDATLNLDETMNNDDMKIEAETDSVFFGHNSILAASANVPSAGGIDLNTNGDMDLKDPIPNNADAFISDLQLDFELLNDFNLPHDYNYLEDILMSDDSNSNSHSSSDGYALDSVADSPPLTPPSPTGSNSSLSQFGISDIKFEPQSPPAPGTIQPVICANNINELKQCIPGIAKSGRGRSASQEAPEVQALKRHIRMIRNRESACLSRKKKKDYVTGIENRIKELEIENLQLKHENSVLKKRLVELGQSISHSTTSIPVNPASAKLGINRAKSNKNTNLPVVAAKIALLGLCCFLFVSFQGPMNNSNTNLPVTNSSTSKIMIEPDSILPRSFLSPSASHSSSQFIQEQHEHAATFIRGKRASKFLESNRIEDNFVNKDGTNINKTSNSNEKNEDKNIRHLKLTHMTGTKLINKSNENIHDKETYRNATLTNAKHCALFNQTEALRVQHHLKGIFGKRFERRKKPLAKPFVYSLIDLDAKSNENKGLTIYDEKMRRYSKLFDNLERREDTYYVVSLAIENQILFPAKAHNNITARPKMSFVIPWRNETQGGKEELMQIDCEVTGVLSLKKPKEK